MNVASHKNQIGIVGLGRSGIAAASFIAEQGYGVLAWDQNDSIGTKLAHHPKIALNHSSDPGNELSRCTTILLSPGIPRSHASLSQALRQGVPVINDVEWLYRHNQAQKTPATFIGITGTNGKSTVTTLVGLMLEGSKLNTQTGGNLGQAALSLWHENVEKYVLELSSFQLESLPSFRPQTAALLNISPDHLDRYEEMDDYLAAKLNIFAHQTDSDYAVLNADEPDLLAAYDKVAAKTHATVVPFSTQKAVPGGFYLQDGRLLDHRGKEPVYLLCVEQLKITGIHNQANALAAAAIALCAGASTAAVVATLSTFPGLAHRMEWIKTVDEVAYYNDSKGTNVGAVMQSLVSFPNQLVLIAGGRDKNGDFRQLAPLIEKHVAHTILIGEAAATMAEIFTGHSTIEQASDMKHAVGLARQRAEPGQVVLLSPACASFDMFKNFEDRGDVFRKAVHEL